jgi:hypothetical protein
VSDHKRGCSGREYTCTCGHDDTITDTIEAQAAEIERLKVECQAQYHRGYYDGRAALGETE